MGELEEKIKRELLKSGFPLQIFCQKCLLKKNWRILQSSEYYLTEDDNKKEVDVVGIRRHKDLPKNTSLYYEIHIECKKNADNPWVFFKDDYSNLGLGVATDYENINNVTWKSPKAYDIKDLHFNNVAISNIYTPAFHRGGNPIYEAVSSVLTSYGLRSDFLKRHREERQRQGKRQNGIRVSFLTILLDGKLYLANIEGDDEINLIESNHIIYFQRETIFPKIKSYTIDIINKNYFHNYLDLLTQDIIFIDDFYKKEISVVGV